MVDMVALTTGGSHDGGVGNGGAVVTADSAGQAGTDGDHQHLRHGSLTGSVVDGGINLDHDGDEDTEGAPGSTGSEGQTHTDQEDDSGQEVSQTAGGLTDKLSHKYGSAQFAGDAGQGPCEGQDQDRGNHSLEAVSQGIGEFLKGDDLAGQVQYDGEGQCQEGAQNQTHGSIGVAESFDEVDAIEKPPV